MPSGDDSLPLQAANDTLASHSGNPNPTLIGLRVRVEVNRLAWPRPKHRITVLYCNSRPDLEGHETDLPDVVGGCGIFFSFILFSRSFATGQSVILGSDVHRRHSWLDLFRQVHSY